MIYKGYPAGRRSNRRPGRTKLKESGLKRRKMPDRKEYAKIAWQAFVFQEL